MRILFFNYEYPPLGGGAGNASFYLLKEYAKNSEIKVDFITSSINEKHQILKLSENITVYKLPIGKNAENIHYQSKKELLKYAWVSYKFAKKLVRENKYDLTHSFFTVPCGIVSFILKNKFKIPYIISLRGSDVPGYSERFTILYKFITPIIKKIWKSACFVIANSCGLRELALKSKTEKEIGIIYNGIDTGDFFPDANKKDENKFTIVCISRITRRKGIKFLIQAVGNLLKKYKNIKLFIVGDGDECDSLKNLVQTIGIGSEVTFTGPILHENILEYYQKSNIFVLPSLNEGMSNTMLEALSCGLPIIATDTGGTKELVQNEKNGFIVKMKDPDDLAEKIEKIMINKNLEIQMGNESRKLSEKFDWSVVAGEYIDLYRNAIELKNIKSKNNNS